MDREPVAAPIETLEDDVEQTVLDAAASPRASSTIDAHGDERIAAYQSLKAGDTHISVHGSVSGPKDSVGQQSGVISPGVSTSYQIPREQLEQVKDADPKIGEIIAERYQIVSYLGGGGMSRVYKAIHLHIKNKSFAIKLLHTKFNDWQQILRLQQEANAVSALSHPNIVSIHDFGQIDGKEPYLVMDFVEGCSIEELIASESQIELTRLLPILSQTCSALAHAHEKGIVHRDIKPSNVLIAKDEAGNDLVKVLDFGIAKVSDSDGELARLTQTGDVLGSPRYMSPEQCTGQPVDGRADIYALGCVIYECVTGKPPFTGATVFETIYKHINDAPPSFSTQFSRKSVYQRLEAIVLKMLAKSPEDRYRFMVEVASDLKHLEYKVQSSWFDLRLMWDLWRARRGARARSSVVVQGLLSASTVVAVIAAVLMFIMPGHIQANVSNMVRNQALADQLESILIALNKDSNFVRGFLLSNMGDKRNSVRDQFQRVYTSSVYLARPDPREWSMMVELCHSTDASFSELKQSLIDIVRGMWEEDSRIWIALSKWSLTLKCNNDLYAYALRQKEYYEEQAKRCDLVFQVSKAVGFVDLLAIPALLLVRLRQIRRQRSSETQS